MYEEILYEVHDPVATITLNRPDKLNALTPSTLAELTHAVADAEAREDVVGIVITGAGRGFCAGLDMQALQAIQQAGDTAAMGSGAAGLGPANPGDPDLRKAFGIAPFAYLLAVRKPVIAAVNGACAGLGFSLATFCDMRFAAEDAKFTTVFAHRGLVAEHGLSWVLPRLIGTSRALDILWSGRKFDGAEAVRLGVANYAVAPDRLVTEAQGYVRSLADASSPTSMLHMKQQVYLQLMQSMADANRETLRLQDESSKWPDLAEGVASFLERRPPNFPRIKLE